MLSRDVVDPDTGEVIAEAGQALTDTLIKKLRKAEITKVHGLRAVRPRRVDAHQEHARQGSDRPDTSPKERKKVETTPKSARQCARQIYALLRPGDAPNTETAKQALERLFFSPKRYDLGRVGRYKINQRLGLQRRRPTTRCSRRTTSSRSSATSWSCTRAAATWTTSTTSATAASVRSAS